MEQLVVLLAIAAISFVNWLIKKSAEQREKRRRAIPPPIARQDDAAEPATWRAPEEDLRKFMEALGLPPDEPPPRVESWQPPAADFEPEPVRVPAAPPPLPEAAVPVYRPPRINRPSEESLALARRLQARQDPIRAGEIGNSSRVREMLRSPSGLRDAMILKEILAEPKGMQSF